MILGGIYTRASKVIFEKEILAMISIKNFKKFLFSIENLFLSSDSFQIFCCYINQTRKIQLIKITNNCNDNWQQIVLPGECFSFKALLKSELEIYADQNSTSIIDVIPCPKLEIIPKK